jgi:hypothetical protein
LDKTKNLTPEERAKVLEEDEGLAEAHQASASSGQTKVSYKLLISIRFCNHIN